VPISEPGVPSEPARHGLPIALALVLIVPLVVVVLLYLLTRFVGPGDSSGKVLARVHAAAIAVLPREVVAYVEAGTGRILTLPESDVALLM
jgi:hypothetical protein